MFFNLIISSLSQVPPKYSAKKGNKREKLIKSDFFSPLKEKF